MGCPYIYLFRSELHYHEASGDFGLVERFLDACAEALQEPKQRAVLNLERSRLALHLGNWDECLALLDEVDSHDFLLSVEDRSLFYLVSAQLHQGYGDLNQALVFLELAVAEAEECQGPRLLEALIEIGSLFHRIGERERANEFLDRAEELAEQLQSPDHEARLALQRGLTAFRTNRPGEAEDYYTRVLHLMTSPHTPSVLKGDALRYLGVLAVLDGRPYEGMAYHRDALACFSDLSYPLGQAKAYNSLGQTCLKLSRHEEARFFLEKAEELCRTLGAEAERATILGKLGSVYAETGQYERAIKFQKQDLESSSRFGNYRALAFALRNLGLSYRAKGDCDQAVIHLRDSRDRFAELEDVSYQVATDLDLVSTLMEHDRKDEAWEYLQDALEQLDKRLEASPDHVHARYFTGVLARQRGDVETAKTVLYEALELSQSFAMQPRQAAVHFELAQIHRDGVDHSAAADHLASAYRLAKACSMQRLLFQAVEGLYELDPRQLFDQLLQPD